MYKFNLQRVLDIRKTFEKEKEKALFVAKMKLKREEKYLALLYQRKEDFAETMNVTGRDSVRRRAEQHRYLNMLLEGIQAQHETILEVAKEVEAKRLTLVQAAKDRKVLEKLKEKKEEAYLQELGRKEQAFLDELARR